MSPNTPRDRLRRLSLKLAAKHDKLPTLLILRSVICTDNHRYGEGAFSEVFCGTYDGFRVALKFPRMYTTMSSTQKEALKKVRSVF